MKSKGNQPRSGPASKPMRPKPAVRFGAGSRQFRLSAFAADDKSDRAVHGGKLRNAVLVTCQGFFLHLRLEPGRHLRLLARVQPSPGARDSHRVQLAGRWRWSGAGRNLRGGGGWCPKVLLAASTHASTPRSNRHILAMIQERVLTRGGRTGMGPVNRSREYRRIENVCAPCGS